jgi:TRAP transporter TAXI family solute receptor
MCHHTTQKTLDTHLAFLTAAHFSGMAAIKTPIVLHFFRFVRNLDPVSKLVFFSLGFASISLVALTTWKLVERIKPPELILVAGDQQGESYIISKAIEEVVERVSNINITVIPTGGTAENLRMLNNGKAQLAAAQADVASEGMDVSAATKPISPPPDLKAEPRTIAVLYKDLFQLVVRDPSIQQFVQLKGKTVALPVEGGQYKSLINIAKHYGLKEGVDIKITGLNQSKFYDDKQAEEDFKFKRADALFRVRALGNQGIAKVVQQHGGRLVPIEQAEAMKIKHPAFESAIIPKGAYQGNPAVPNQNIPTVAVSRLLLASNTVNKTVIQEITRIIFEHRQEIANAVSPEHPEIKPLIASIDDPRKTSSPSIPSLHAGVLAFYDRYQPSFIQENADFFALIITVVVLVFSWIRQLKIWMESSRKNEADEYMESAINLMKVTNHKDLEKNQKELDEVFRKAADALIDEQISQESFRTFNEAYKNTREAIERERQLAQQNKEQKQRETSAKYIKAIVELLRDNQPNQDLVQRKINQILKEVVEKLIADEISQESFRTFIEAYKTARDAVTR